MIDLTYPSLLDLFREHIIPPRTESAAFLIWYLENYVRLDSQEAVDSVCDKKNDKGVDGIYVNDNDNTIYIFQSKISQKKDAKIGDVVLKEFRGTLAQFESRENIAHLIKSPTTADELIRLIKEFDLIDKCSNYELRGVFLSNTDIDANGDLYLEANSQITFVGKTSLQTYYISDQRTGPIPNWAKFDIAGFDVSEYMVEKNTKAVIAPVKASDLVKLQGITDQSLFALNVRGPLGNTQVNKDIVKSIKSLEIHKYFPLFHNGITIICNQLTNDENKIAIKDYYVVNGCQSLWSLYQNQKHISDDLRILTKFILVDVDSELSENITRYSNNQNGVKPRDFKSNHPIQVRLQNEFKAIYPNEYYLEVKRGELPGSGEVISNEMAGLHLMSFDLKEPWGTHRKYQVFEDKYVDIWGRPEVTADRIVMCHVIMEVIDELMDKVNNKLFGKYSLTKYILLYMIRSILENDLTGKALIQNPTPFVRSKENRLYFGSCIRKIADDIIVDVNGEVDEYGDDFDYRGKIRDEAWVKELSKKVVGNYLKLAQRGRIDSFEIEWGRKV